MEPKINLNGFEYTFTEEREWIFKAMPVQRKLHVQEKPQIKACIKIEEEYHKFFDEQLAHVVKDINKYLGG